MRIECFIVSGEGGPKINMAVKPMSATIIREISIEFQELTRIMSGAAIIELSIPLKAGVISDREIRYGVIAPILEDVSILEVKNWPKMATLYHFNGDEGELLSAISINSKKLIGIDRIFLCRTREEAEGN